MFIIKIITPNIKKAVDIEKLSAKNPKRGAINTIKMDLN